MGRRLQFAGHRRERSDLEYESVLSIYRAMDCSRCTLRSMCHKGKGDRVITVNHRNNELRAMARELLTSEEGLRHRSARPVWSPVAS